MKFLALLVLSAALLTSACGNNAATDGEKVFRYGTPAYGIANENAGMDPHEAYQGWSAIRYGVGETLFKFDDTMQPQPWLAEKYEFINENTVKITLKDNIYFTSGNKMTGAAVKACLEDLISRHNRARVDLKITGITAEGQTVTIASAAKVPVLINYLCDPYGCIIDMSRGTGDDTKISGTGPFMVESLTPKEVVLVKNPASAALPTATRWHWRCKTAKLTLRRDCPMLCCRFLMTARLIKPAVPIPRARFWQPLTITRLPCKMNA